MNGKGFLAAARNDKTTPTVTLVPREGITTITTGLFGCGLRVTWRRVAA